MFKGDKAFLQLCFYAIIQLQTLHYTTLHISNLYHCIISANFAVET